MPAERNTVARSGKTDQSSLASAPKRHRLVIEVECADGLGFAGASP